MIVWWNMIVFGKSHCAAVCRKESQQLRLCCHEEKRLWGLSGGGVFERYLKAGVWAGHLRQRVFWGWENVAGVGRSVIVGQKWAAEALGDKATEAKGGEAGLLLRKRLKASRSTKFKKVIGRITSEYKIALLYQDAKERIPDYGNWGQGHLSDKRMRHLGQLY